MGKDQSKLQRERLGQQSDWKGEEGSGREAKGGIMKTVNAVTTRNIFNFYDAIPDTAISSHVCEWSNSFSQETGGGDVAGPSGLTEEKEMSSILQRWSGKKQPILVA